MGDWSNLPIDLYMLIADKLSIADLFLFASVCVEWHEVAKRIYTTFPSRPPLLMLPFKKETQTSNFLDLSGNSVCDIKLPELHDKWICGASNGWLITLDKNLNIELLNPYSKAKLQLPDHSSKRDYTPYQYVYMRKVILSGSPSSCSGCFVAAITSAWERLAICRVGDDKWTTIETERNQYLDIICYKEKIIGARYSNALVVVDAGKDSKVTYIDGPMHSYPKPENFTQKYLVESSGDLLLILRVVSIKRKRKPYYKTYRFHVYKLDESMEGWTKIENLGGRALFVGNSHSFSVSVSGVSSCRPNCIYYLDDKWLVLEIIKAGLQVDCGVFCLEDGSIEPLPKEASSLWPTPGYWCMQCL